MDDLDKAMAGMDKAQAVATKAQEAAAAAASGQPWTPELVTTLCFSVLAFGLIICGIMAVLIYKEKRASDLVRVFSLPLIIVSAVVLVIAGFSDKQISSVIGLLGGLIAGYLLGSYKAEKDSAAEAGK